jgi:hypothetical protein
MNLSNRNNRLEDAAKKILEGKDERLDEAVPKTINVPVGAKMQECKYNKKSDIWEATNKRSLVVKDGGKYEVVDVEDKYRSGLFYIFKASGKTYMINQAEIKEAEQTPIEENAIIHDDFLSKNLGKELVLTISNVSQIQQSPGAYGKAWVMTFKGHDKKNKWGMKAQFAFDPKLSKEYKAGDKVKVVLSNKPYYPNITSIEKI